MVPKNSPMSSPTVRVGLHVSSWVSPRASPRGAGPERDARTGPGDGQHIVFDICRTADGTLGRCRATSSPSSGRWPCCGCSPRRRRTSPCRRSPSRSSCRRPPPTASWRPCATSGWSTRTGYGALPARHRLQDLPGGGLDPNLLRSQSMNWADSLAANTGEAVLIGIPATTGSRSSTTSSARTGRRSGSASARSGRCTPRPWASAAGAHAVAPPVAESTLERYTSRTTTDRGGAARRGRRIRPSRLRHRRRRVRERHGRSGGARSGSTAASASGAISVLGPTDRIFATRRACRTARSPTVVRGRCSPPARALHRASRPAPRWPTRASPRSTRARLQPLPAVRPRRPHGLGGQLEHRHHYPQPGWVEHDAVEIWRNVTRVVPRALRQAGIDIAQVATLGIANQRETTVVWDRHTGRPVAQRDHLAGHPHRRVRRGAQAGPAPRCSARSAASSRRQLLRRPAAALAARPRARAARARRGRRRAVRHDGDLADLEPDRRPDGGVHVTDVTNASRTMLMDLRHLPVGRPPGAALDIPPADASRDPRQRRGLRHLHDACCRGCHRRGARRPAGGPGGPDLLRPWRGEVHLRHRRVPAAQHRHPGRQVDPRAAPDGRPTTCRATRRSTPWRGRSR